MVERLDWKEKYMRYSVDFLLRLLGFVICIFRAVTNKLFLICRLFSLNVVLLAKVKP